MAQPRSLESIPTRTARDLESFEVHSGPCPELVVEPQRRPYGSRPLRFLSRRTPSAPQAPHCSKQALADTACERITAGIVRAELARSRPIQAVLDPYNPTGSTRHVAFNTTKTERCATDAHRCHVNWVVLDSDWEAEFCRVAEKHPRVRALKNHNLGPEVAYRYQAETRKHRLDFIVRIQDRDNGQGDEDPPNLVVEIKGYRGEDAKEKKNTMDNVVERTGRRIR